MRVLIVVPPLVGHISPTLGVAAELGRRGHRVEWAGEPDFLSRFLPPGAIVHACEAGWTTQSAPARPAELRGPAAFKFLWESIFVPLADAMAPGVEAAIRSSCPDVVLTDQHALAGALVAERLGVPWLTSATTSAELMDPLAGLPLVGEWLRDRLCVLRSRIGDPAATVDPRFSPTMTIAFTVPELVGTDGLVETPVRFVGPVLRPSRVDDIAAVDWVREVDDAVTVLVALGTMNTEVSGPFLVAALAGLDGLSAESGRRIRTVIADPGGALAGIEHSEDVLVCAQLPQQRLLEHVDVFIGHAGHNGVCEALWNDVPMALAPIRDDQPLITTQLVEEGAAVRLRFSRPSPERTAAAVLRLVDEPGFRESARRLGARLRGAGGAAAAVDAIEQAVPAHLPSGSSPRGESSV